MRLLRLKVDKLHDYHSVQNIRTQLLNLRGIRYIRVTRDLGHVLVEYIDAALSPDMIVNHISKMGHQVTLY
jgi:copper chaperone CopZ